MDPQDDSRDSLRDSQSSCRIDEERVDCKGRVRALGSYKGSNIRHEGVKGNVQQLVTTCGIVVADGVRGRVRIRAASCKLIASGCWGFACSTRDGHISRGSNLLVLVVVDEQPL